MKSKMKTERTCVLSVCPYHWITTTNNRLPKIGQELTPLGKNPPGVVLADK